jgi:hypothetical protein
MALSYNSEEFATPCCPTIHPFRNTTGRFAMTSTAPRWGAWYVCAAGLSFGAALAATSALADQKGYDTVVCHTDTAYIYQYQDTSSAQLDALPRGAHFHVYHEDIGWRFGVRNYNGVSGYVLARQLCKI